MKKWFKRISILLAVIFIAGIFCLLYAYFIEPNRLVINEQTLEIEGWNTNFNDFKIVAISDIHGGSNFITEEKIKEIVLLDPSIRPRTL